MKKKQNIGILGGTFDPVHKGHLAVSKMVLERYGLDQILFIPAFSPPHKERCLTSFSHRVAMLEIALKSHERMSVSLLEAERKAPSYTVETLQEVHRRMESCSFFLIMGADMFVEIELWYRYRDLFALADIIVVSRPGVDPDRVAMQVAALPGDFIFDRAQQMWCREDGFRIFYCPDVAESISSSEIRSRVAQGASVKAYLIDPVRDYIHQHRLYSSPGHINCTI